MKSHTTFSFVFLGALVGSGAVVVACSSDDGSAACGQTMPDGGGAADANLSTTPFACGDTTGLSPMVLTTVFGSFADGGADSELVAIDPAAKKELGRVATNTTWSSSIVLGATEPYLVGNGTISRLDARKPWNVLATWFVPATDGGSNTVYHPSWLVTPSCTKAFFLSSIGTSVAVFDQSQPTGGTLSKYIDLSVLKAPGVTAAVSIGNAVYVPERRRIYIEIGDSSSRGCGDQPRGTSIAALDVDTSSPSTWGAPVRGA